MKYVKLMVTVVIVFVLMFLFLRNIKFSAVFDAFGRINIFLPLVFLAGTMGQLLLKGYRWGLILRPQKRISLKTLYNFTAISYLINTLVPGKAGEPAKGILIAREENLEKGYGLASVVLERMIDFIMMILLFLVSVLFLKNTGSETVVNLKKWSLILLPAFIFVVIMFYLVNLPRFYRLVEKFTIFCARILPKKYRKRVVNFMLHFVRGLKLNLKFTEYLKLIFSSAIVWLWVIPFYWILMQGFDFGKTINFLDVFPWFCVIVASAAIPTPGMVGSLEMGSTIAFTKVLLVDGEKFGSIIGAYTLLFHFILIVVSVAAGLIALKSQGLTFKAIKNLKEQKVE